MEVNRDGEDEVCFYITDGSAGGHTRHLFSFTRKELDQIRDGRIELIQMGPDVGLLADDGEQEAKLAEYRENPGEYK